MKDDLPIYNSERTKALTWLREVLTAILEISPLSYWQKKKTARLLNRMPDWILDNWAEALNIDYIGGCTGYPDMAEKAKSETGRHLAQQYLESHNAVPAGNSIDQLGKSVVKSAKAGRLPADRETVERQACALAWADCTPAGADFAQQGSSVLGSHDRTNHVIIDYQIALDAGDKNKVEALDAVLTGGRYGEWVDNRLDEAKRYLGLDTPIFRIHFGERTPQWDALWGNIIKGGTDD